jgi:hypothetical protein
MTDVPDLWQAAADGMFARLDAAIAADEAFVRQEMPNTPAGLKQTFVLVADMDGEPAGGKYEIADEVTVDVHFVYRGPAGRRGLRALMWKGRQALQNQEIEADGVHFSTVSWVEGLTGQSKDGVTFVGKHSFKVTAEPA